MSGRRSSCAAPAASARWAKKALHLALKYYFAPDPECHEIPVGGFVADIVGERGVIEIQTRNLYKLIRKLDGFLEACDVTVVYPIAATKWVIWTEAAGTVSSRRKSPLHGDLTSAVPELYALKYMLDNPRFHFCACLLELEEYHLLDGRGKSRKQHATRLDRVPLALLDEVQFDHPADYRRLLPPGLPERFCARDLAGLSGMALPVARMLLNMLSYLELLTPAGKSGNTLFYTAN